MEPKQYKKKMRELSKERNFRARFRDLMRQKTEEVEQQLSELGLNTYGSHRAKCERLFRGILRTVGAEDVPWYPDQDEAGGYLRSGRGFIGVSHQPNPRATHRRHRKLLLPRDSSSDSEGYSLPPLSFSRLRADFRDLSP